MYPIWLREIITYAPILAIAFVQISGIDPVLQIVRNKNIGVVSAIPFLALTVNASLWTYYGVLIGDLTVWISNAAGILCGSAYFLVFCLYANAVIRRSNIRIAIGVAVLLAMAMKLPILFNDGRYESEYVGFLGCISAVCMMCSPLGHMKRVMNEESTQSMSLVVSLAMTLNGLSWAIYGAIIADYNLFIVAPNFIGCIAGCIQLVLFVIYPREKYHEMDECINEPLSESPDRSHQDDPLTPPIFCIL